MKVFFFGLLIFISQASTAQYLAFESTFDHHAQNYISVLSQTTTDVWEDSTPEKQEFCEKRYQSLLNDGVLDIRISLGYFDWTEQLNTNIFGQSPSIDLGAFASLRKFLLYPCMGESLFCGFMQDPSNSARFYRKTMIRGDVYLVQIEMQYASASQYLDMNRGQGQAMQKMRTQYVEQFFVKSLQEADVAIYFGHSRDGGGPDFAPPVFVKGKNKVDYEGYYKKKKPGYKLMMNALQKAVQPAPVIAMMSCDSRGHFLKQIRSAASNSGIISTTKIVDVAVAYTAMIGAIDSLIRGQCDSLYQAIRLTPENQEGVTMDGMFE